MGYKLGEDHGDPEIATIAGGLIGASVGHGISRRSQDYHNLHVRGPCTPRGRDYRHVEPVEYRVRYRYNGRVYSESMDYDPGKWVALNVEVFPARS